MRYVVVLLLMFMALAGCSTEIADTNSKEWQISPIFTISYTGADGKPHEYILRGEEGRLGFLDGPTQTEKGLLDTSLIAGKPNKYMWHFWGKPDELKGKVKIIGIHETGEETKVLLNSNGEYVWDYPGVGGPNNGADAHMPSVMGFPTSGLWRLDVYIGDHLFGNIVIDVKESSETKTG